MAVTKTEEIAVGALGGVMMPALFQQYSPGESATAVLKDLPGPLSQKPVQAGVFGGATGLGLAWLGHRGGGPLARNESAINMAAAFGAGSLGVALTYMMYGPTTAAAKGVRLGRPTKVSVRKEKAEREAETPSGEAIGGF